MAGSIKWFIYTDDTATDYAIKLDESNTEAVNGGTQDYTDANTISAALPRNIRPRRLYYSNAARTRIISCVALTPTIYSGVVNGGNATTIADPIAGGTATLSLIRAEGERRSIPFPVDTGLDDGDAT